ncbi:hypothetical protein T265_08884 [Opisthorchis viverrini]|uniref:Integrase catalytic domain-containing protein n=1 Tax=Opisthorchis viverrini TaxID=6198 RepID=A0A074Z7N8_OPIVI|nr:hypothetical protein T265_08884 [Opisthorchis viverrini]KER23191.1 hypothetical protein T265_08884 [Opisthorchis viverrini]
MQKEIRTWAKQCLDCQKSKIHRYTISPTGSFQLPDSRFRNVHIDLVGPLPPSRGFTRILTCVDCFTRWPMAIPINDTSAENVARTFVDGWIATFGVPATITTDRGPQFTSKLFHYLKRLLGTDHFRTTAYHPAANGMVVRFHRQLKASLIASSSTHWSERLSLILLSIRNTVKEDLGCTSAELAFGTTLRLPGLDNLAVFKPSCLLRLARQLGTGGVLQLSALLSAQEAEWTAQHAYLQIVKQNERRHNYYWKDEPNEEELKKRGNSVSKFWMNKA